MNSATTGTGVNQYKDVNRQTGVTEASPHRLIQMLLDGAIDKVAVATGAMQRGEIENKGNHITSAVSIIIGLRSSLDLEGGGEIARNLNDLYDYMMRRLMEAHQANDVAALDEVASLLREVKRGWDAIPEAALDDKGQSGSSASA